MAEELTAQPAIPEMPFFPMEQIPVPSSYLWHGTGLEQTHLGPHSNKKHHLPDPGAG